MFCYHHPPARWIVPHSSEWSALKKSSTFLTYLDANLDLVSPSHRCGSWTLLGPLASPYALFSLGCYHSSWVIQSNFPLCLIIAQCPSSQLSDLCTAKHRSTWAQLAAVLLHLPLFKPALFCPPYASASLTALLSPGKSTSFPWHYILPKVDCIALGCPRKFVSQGLCEDPYGTNQCFKTASVNTMRKSPS